MDASKVLRTQVDVVAALGELAAAATLPCRDTRPFISPESLHAALREFTQTLGDTLRLHGVTSLGYLGATPAVTSGATGAYSGGTVSAWQKSVDALWRSWNRVSREAMELFGALEGKTTYRITSLLADMYDRDNEDTDGDNLVDAAQQPPVALVSAVTIEAREGAVVATSQAGAATRKGQWERDVRRLLWGLIHACDKAGELSCWLRCQLSSSKLIHFRRTHVLEALLDTVAKTKRLSEASAQLAMDHLLGTIGDIHDLLLSPSGGPGGPGGCTVAELCQEAIEDIPRLCTEQRTAPSCGKTSNGSSMTGTPEQPEGTWGKPEPGAVCETGSNLPSNPGLLPPGTQCELATSKFMGFLQDCYHEWIPIGVTGTSQQRQDFLIIGKDSNRTLGLSVLPAVVSVNCNEELRVLAFTYKAPMVIEPKTPIAIAIALPMNTNKPAGYREMLLESFNPRVRWVKHITNERPELTCSLTHLDETVCITGKLDTGADVTVIPFAFWPGNWNLVPPERTLTGVGGATVCAQSEFMITVTGPEGKTATTRPYVMRQLPVTLWGRDVLSQWRAKMEVDS